VPLNLIPLLRNSKDNYNTLERLFGTMHAGMAFGESCMFGSESHSLYEKNKFYQAVALTDSYYLTLSLKDYRNAMLYHEDQIEKDQLNFLRKIPEFTHLGKNLLRRLCKDFKALSVVKGSVLYTEGRPADFLFFIKSG
jgi:CRP-like cAMP-binding protein